VSPTLREIMADDGYLDLRRDMGRGEWGATVIESDETGEDDDVCEIHDRMRRRLKWYRADGGRNLRKIAPRVVREIYTAEHPYVVAKKHGVHQTAVAPILSGKTYARVTESLTKWTEARAK